MQVVTALEQSYVPKSHKSLLRFVSKIEKKVESAEVLNTFFFHLKWETEETGFHPCNFNTVFYLLQS